MNLYLFQIKNLEEIQQLITTCSLHNLDVIGQNIKDFINVFCQLDYDLFLKEFDNLLALPDLQVS